MPRDFLFRLLTQHRPLRGEMKRTKLTLCRAGAPRPPRSSALFHGPFPPGEGERIPRMQPVHARRRWKKNRSLRSRGWIAGFWFCCWWWCCCATGEVASLHRSRPRKRHRRQAKTYVPNAWAPRRRCGVSSS